MKKVFYAILLIGFLLHSVTVSAAEIASSDQAKQSLQQMQTSLGLTDEQVKKIEPINQAQQVKMELLLASFEQKIKAMMSEEQYAKFKNLQQNYKGSATSEAEQLDLIKKEVGLSDTQIASYRDIAMEVLPKVFELHQESALKIKPILSESQWETLEKISPKMPEQKK